MIINNPKRKYVYFNQANFQQYDNLLELIDINIIRNANLEAHVKNISNFFSRPDKNYEVFEGINLIPPRTKWLLEGQKYYSLNQNNVYINYINSKSDFINILKRICSVLINKKIAIELSGGLDTSIIIGLINKLGIEPFLIGSVSSRYEFRTESFIQYKYLKTFKQGCLLSENNSLPFSSLKETPLHQYPSSSSLYYMHALNIAKECEIHGVEILLSGMGFDTLLCDSLSNYKKSEMPNNWYKWMLDDNWFNENIFDKVNITYCSAAASQVIIQSIFELRKSLEEDLKKKWARNYFQEYLPKELVNYSYKADNSGGFLDGFNNAENTIREIFKVAFEITLFQEFNIIELDKLFKNSHLVNEETDKLILGRVSFANWLYGLVRDNII
jgi:hypothetical protein